MSKQKPDGTYPYRPSNGTEGQMFADRFCDRCKHDDAFQKGGDAEDGCPIIAKTMSYYADDVQYPPEWISDDDCGLVNPRCTAYDPVETMQTIGMCRCTEVPEVKR